MAGGIILAVIAAVAVTYFSARAYDAHRLRRLARMRTYFTTFADMAQLLLRGHKLTERQVGAIEFMLSAFQDDRHGWLVVRAYSGTHTSNDPSATAELRATPDPVLEALGIAIDSYYLYIAEVQPVAGYFMRRCFRAAKAENHGAKSQNEARAISVLAAAFDRRHPTPA